VQRTDLSEQEARVKLAQALAPELIDAVEALVEARVRAVLRADELRQNGLLWMSIVEAADYLRVSPRTIQRMVANGRLQSTTLGRRRLVKRGELDRVGEGTPLG